MLAPLPVAPPCELYTYTAQNTIWMNPDDDDDESTLFSKVQLTLESRFRRYKEKTQRLEAAACQRPRMTKLLGTLGNAWGLKKRYRQ
jgi:hypothetical protein